jgi:hypothetical protein
MANIVVTGIGLYLRKDNARYCPLRNAVNLENVQRWRNSASRLLPCS